MAGEAGQTPGQEGQEEGKSQEEEGEGAVDFPVKSSLWAVLVDVSSQVNKLEPSFTQGNSA